MWRVARNGEEARSEAASMNWILVQNIRHKKVDVQKSF